MTEREDERKEGRTKGRERKKENKGEKKEKGKQASFFPVSCMNRWSCSPVFTLECTRVTTHLLISSAMAA